MPIIEKLSETFFPDLGDLKRRFREVLSDDDYLKLYGHLLKLDIFRADLWLEGHFKELDIPLSTLLGKEEEAKKTGGEQSFNVWLEETKAELKALQPIMRDWRRLMRRNRGARRITQLIVRQVVAELEFQVLASP